MNLVQIAALLAVAMWGAGIAAGVTWFACRLFDAATLLTVLATQCAGLIGLAIALGGWILLRVNAFELDLMD